MLPPIDIAKGEAQLRVGTCSWKYDSWKGLVYEPDKSYGPYDYLADYARHFNTVEIDQWFWSLFPTGAKLPSPDTARRYAESVPADFRFSVKAPNAITLTHYYARQPKASQALANQPNPHFLDVDLVNRFLQTLEPMGDKLGPIMFQFEYLNKKKMGSREEFMDRFGAFLEKLPEGFMYAIESRNPNYLQEDFLDLLRSHHVALVLLEGYYMPHIWELAARLDLRTGPFSVIRLHGPDRAKIEQQTSGMWDTIAAPKDEGLAAVADMIKPSLRAETDIYVNVNNHYEGCAPLTIDRLMTLLAGKDTKDGKSLEA